MNLFTNKQMTTNQNRSETIQFGNGTAQLFTLRLCMTGGLRCVDQLYKRTVLSESVFNKVSNV